MNNTWSAKIHDTINGTGTLTIEPRILTDNGIGYQLTEDQ
jgi:hypothetical protein